MQDFEKEVENLNKKRIDGNSEVNRAVDEQIDIIQERYLIEKERLEEILLVNQKIAESINQQRKAHERVYDMTQKVKDIQDGYALDTLVGIEKELAQIEIAERKVADAAMFRVQQETMNLPQGEREKKIAEEAERINQAMAESIKIQSQAAKKGYEESRRWSTGWNKAMKEYVENATNAAKRAQDVFTTATQNMEEAIVQFAKTGKFEWRSFVSSIVEELLRQQVRELIAKTFGGMSAPASGGGGGGGGILGAIGGLLGFANGGIIPTNGPVIVGERGPELLMGARGSQVVPNNQLGGTNVVYNINAVDAASFKQMIARDPSFIYAVSQQGAKSIPSTRR
jgi:lambda family phage tail tape measure protein